MLRRSYASSYVMIRSITSVYKQDNFDSLRGLVCALYPRIVAILEQYCFFSILQYISRQSRAFGSTSPFLTASRNGELQISMSDKSLQPSVSRNLQAKYVLPRSERALVLLYIYRRIFQISIGLSFMQFLIMMSR